MLRFLRERGNSWVLKGLLAFIALTFISWGGFTLSQGPAVPGGKVAAWVNKTPISALEFDRRYYQQVESLRRQLGNAFNEEMIKQFGLRRRLLASMVFEELEVQEADRLGLQVTNAEVALKIQELPYFQVGGRFDPVQYRQLLESNRLTPHQFEMEQRRLLTTNRLRRYVTQGVTVSDQEVRDHYRWLNARAHVQMIPLSSSLFAKEVVIEPKDVKAYYEKNKESYRVGPQRKVAWWYLPYNVLEPRVPVTEKELENRYEQTKSHYALKERVSVSQILIKLSPDASEAAVKKARSLLDDLRKRAKSEKSFAALARKYSQGPAAKKGGDMGTFGPGEMLPEIEKVVATLKKGEMSEPVRTGFGMHLILLRDRQKARQRTFKEVRSEVEKDLRTVKARAEALKELRQVRYAIEDKKPEPKITGLRKGETGYFERNVPPVAPPEGALMAKLAFDLNGRKMSQETPGEEGALFVRLEDSRPSRIPPLNEVEKQVREDLRSEKASEIAAHKADGWLQELREGKRSFKQLAKAVGVKTLAPAPFTRRDAPGPLKGATDAVRTIFSLGKGKFERVRVGGSIYLVHVVGALSVDMSGFEGQKKELRKQILEEKKGVFYSRYIDSLRQAAKVRIAEGFTL